MSLTNINFKNGLINLAFTSLVSVIVTMTTFWVTYMKDIPTKKEVEAMIENSSYAKDKGVIMIYMSEVKDLRLTINRLEVSIANLTGTLEQIKKGNMK